MSARPRKSQPEPPTPEPVDDGVKRPSQLVLMALVVCGMWLPLWVAGVALLPLAFAFTWSGRWERRHSLMVPAAGVWGFGTAAQLAAEPDRGALGLGGWSPPSWLSDLGGQQGFAMLVLQVVGLGLFAWAADGLRSYRRPKPS